MQRHLLERLAEIPGGHGSGELATLRKDIEKTLTPYGFRLHHDNPRHGYCLGTALLSAPRLVEIHGVVQHVAQRLGDPTAQDLLDELEQRLSWGGIEVTATPPLRTYLDGAHPGAESQQQGTLAEPREAERIETAILEHRRVRLLRQSTFGGSDNRGEEIRAWPLQLVFSAGLWHLAWEDDAIGRPHGLLQSERLEQLVFLQAEPRGRRNESDHSTALARLQRLLHHCGGIELGDDLTAQEGLCQPSSEQRRRQLQTLRLSCKSEAYAAIRQGQLPCSLDQIRLERPAKQAKPTAAAQGTTADWVHPELARVLTPNPSGDSHPHPLEIDLPPWILARGSALRIEAPEALRQEQQGQALEMLALAQRR